MMVNKSKLLRVGAIALVLSVLVFSLSFAEEESVTLDGKIGGNEYQHHYFNKDIKMDVYWTITDYDLLVAVKAPAKGWVGFGLRPVLSESSEAHGMKDADFLIGFVKDGQASARDDWGDTPYSHKADTQLGGADSIEEFAGSEQDGSTVIEFERLLNTRDQFDYNVPARGEVYLAYSGRDNFSSEHMKGQRTEAYLNFANGASKEEEEEEEH